MDLRDKKVIVTGGVRGLGRQTVEKLVSKGAVVTVFDLDVTGLDELKGHVAACVQCDVSDYDQVVAATTRFHEEHGAADVLINNAGVLYSEPLVRITAAGIERHDVSQWNRVLAADLSSVFYMTSCVVAQMVMKRVRGVIVNISSVAAPGNAGQSAYSAAKAGVNALTATWAKELGPMGIRVVAVAPGFINTPILGKDAAMKEALAKQHLHGKLIEPEQVASVVAFLFTDGASAINGSTIPVEDGFQIFKNS